jgi:hypothetical protein
MQTMLLTAIVAAIAGGPAFAQSAAFGSDADLGSFSVSAAQLGPAARAFVRAPWTRSADPDQLFAGSEPVRDFLRDIFGHS